MRAEPPTRPSIPPWLRPYWQIGRRIVEEEQGDAAKATYGEGLLRALSKDLTAEFGMGFSLANLKNFRKFYLTYPDGGKSYALRSLLTWTHHRLIMRVESPSARVLHHALGARELEHPHLGTPDRDQHLPTPALHPDHPRRRT